MRLLVSSESIYEGTMEFLNWRIYGFFFSFINVMFRALYIGITRTKVLTLSLIHIFAEHRAMLDDYIARTKDDYRSLKVDADPRCRNHTPGYPNHEGPGVREILKRK